MTIKQLSKISGVHSETIRMYRKIGLLHPHQNPVNHYYDYTKDDFLNLLYIRKLRESGISLETIALTYRHSQTEEVLTGFHREMEELDRQIDQLQKKRAGLELTLRHLEEYRENSYGVAEVTVPDDKLDCYFEGHQDDPAFLEWTRAARSFTPVIGIEKEQLLAFDELPEILPVKPGLGTYRPILEVSGLPLPQDHVVCPAGQYVTAKVELADLDHIRREQLVPMMEYIRAHGLQIDSHTTAFLFRIDYSKEKPVFIYRLRVKVKQGRQGN